jgi:prepilin-type N-terminal cleavage/methylation domain-containing protein
MRIFINKNNKGLTLIEILVSVVVGSIMMIAIYFSFSVFTGSYLAIIEKMTVNKSLRNSMAMILKDLRAAGYVDINTSLAKNISNFIVATDGGTVSPDSINIIYDLDRTQRIQVTYKLNKNSDNLTNQLTKTIKVCTDSNCTQPGGPSSVPETKIADLVEDLQFYFYKENGSSLPSNSDPKLIKYVEVNLVIRSANEILKIPLSKRLVCSDNTSFIYTSAPASG